MRRRPSIEAADLPQSGELGSHYRRPRDTDLSSFDVLLCLAGTVRADSRTPHLARADGPRTTLTLHADLAIPSRPTTMRAGGRVGQSSHAAAGSAAQAEALDQRAVALHVDLGDVFEQTAPASDQQQQPAPRVVVVLVQLEVFGQVSDPLGQQRDLGLRRPGVRCRAGRKSPGFLFSARR